MQRNTLKLVEWARRLGMKTLTGAEIAEAIQPVAVVSADDRLVSPLGPRASITGEAIVSLPAPDVALFEVQAEEGGAGVVIEYLSVQSVGTGTTSALARTLDAPSGKATGVFVPLYPIGTTDTGPNQTDSNCPCRVQVGSGPPLIGPSGPGFRWSAFATTILGADNLRLYLPAGRVLYVEAFTPGGDLTFSLIVSEMAREAIP